MTIDLFIEDKNPDIQIFASTPSLGDMMPFLQLLVAIDTFYTPYTNSKSDERNWGVLGERGDVGDIREWIT